VPQAGGAGAALLLRQEEVPSPGSGLPPDASVSVIVPALNESKCIEEAVRHLRRLSPAACEVIVVDGGSGDGTTALARRAGARAVRAPRGRAAQMNAGAAAASGDLLLFVHADSRPPADAVAAARRALGDPRVVLGGFSTLIQHRGRTLWFSTAHNWLSTYYAPLLFDPAGFARGLRCLFGDQTLFCRAADFRRAGGFDGALPIMEDADLCIRLHERGRVDGRRGREVQLRGAANRTSGRRIAPWGNLRATAVQVRLALAWRWGASPAELRQLYDALYTDAFR
jgi:rSAM/selenodomain-associated transferase 2